MPPSLGNLSNLKFLDLSSHESFDLFVNFESYDLYVNDLEWMTSLVLLYQ